MAKIEIIPLFPPAEQVDLNGEIDHDPPIHEEIEVHILQNARVNYYGYVFKNGRAYEHFITPRHRGTITLKNSLSNYMKKKVIRVDSPILSVAHGWYDNYYHFTLEILVKIFLLKAFLNEVTVIFPEKTSDFHKKWFELIGLTNILYIKENEVVVSPKVISCNFPNRDLNHHHLITPLFRDWILSKAERQLKEIQNTTFPKLFINRKKAQKRKLINEKEVIKLLKAEGYEIIDLEDFSICEQIRLFQHAEKIVSVHGASLANLLFCSPNTVIIDLIHEEYLVNCYTKLSVLLKLEYSKITCKGKQFDRLPGYRDLFIDCEQLSKVL